MSLSLYRMTDIGKRVHLFRARVAANLRTLRLRAGLTQAQLARESGVCRESVQKIEYGEWVPGLWVAYCLCAALDVPLEALFDLRARYDQDAVAPVVVMPGE